MRRPGGARRRVNVDCAAWVMEALDREAERRGGARQALVKRWIAERRRGAGGMRERLGVDDKRKLKQDLPHKPADPDPGAAKAAVDALIEQLRAAPGQPALRDRSKRRRRWSTFDSLLVAVAVGLLLALAVIYVSFVQAPPTP